MIYRDTRFESVNFLAPGQTFENCTFENCQLNLDEATILSCRLRNCVMHYAGRVLTINGMDAADCVFAPGGDLLRGLQTMAAMFPIDELGRMIHDLASSDRTKLN